MNKIILCEHRWYLNNNNIISYCLWTSIWQYIVLESYLQINMFAQFARAVYQRRNYIVIMALITIEKTLEKNLSWKRLNDAGAPFFFNIDSIFYADLHLRSLQGRFRLRQLSEDLQTVFLDGRSHCDLEAWPAAEGNGFYMFGRKDT